ncbi:MAG: FAD-binding protein [Pseudomonadota bacterium]
MLRPSVEWELAGTLVQLTKAGRTIRLMGAGTKAQIGPHLDADVTMTLADMRGITRFEPAEQIMSAKAGTPVRDIERELSKYDLMLPFEPVDLGPIFGREPRIGTIGAVFATNLSGSRRIAAGSAADHLIGATVVTGQGDILDLGGLHAQAARHPDLLAALSGSWGTLGAITQVAFSVAPQDSEMATVVLAGLLEDVAVAAMADALAADCGVTGAVHIDADLAGRFTTPVLERSARATVVRLEGPAAVFAGRLSRLLQCLAVYGQCDVVDDRDSAGLWSEIQGLSPFQSTELPVWRLVVPPSRAGEVLRDIRRYFPCSAMLDWAGGLIWLETFPSSDAGAPDIRRVLANLGGYATLVRADEEVRGAVDCFQPLDLHVDRLARRVKSVFDPRQIFNPGRSHAGY